MTNPIEERLADIQARLEAYELGQQNGHEREDAEANLKASAYADLKWCVDLITDWLQALRGAAVIAGVFDAIKNEVWAGTMSLDDLPEPVREAYERAKGAKV